MDLKITGTQLEIHPDQLRQSFEAVAGLYPYQPSLSLWRAWEHAVYQEHDLPGPVLDLGCGDGRFFTLLWPERGDVIGLDRNAVALAVAAREKGYRLVCQSDAVLLPFEEESFGSVFSNCVLEHLQDPLPVLREVHCCLRPGGKFLFSVITKQLVDWIAPPWHALSSDSSHRFRTDSDLWTTYHSIEKALSAEEWRCALEAAGFAVERQTPILPENSARVFLYLDILCHTPTSDGEVSSHLQSYLKNQRNFPEAYSHIVEGLCLMEIERQCSGGVVFMARKPC